jgi:hypothetical protein
VPEQSTGFVCASCGVAHQEVPLAFAVPTPAQYEAVSRWLRWYRCRFVGDPRNPDLCIIGERHFYLRGELEVPVTDGHRPFVWGVWVSLSHASFERTLEIWQTPGRESEPPQFGWLSVQLPLYPPTLNLKTMVHTRPVGIRPYVELEPTDHPLAVEQRSGITMARATELALGLLHGGT